MFLPFNLFLIIIVCYSKIKLKKQLQAFEHYKYPVNLIGCNRDFQFDLSLKSLEVAVKGRYENDVIVFASVDCEHQPTIDVIKRWESKSPNILRVVYVESYQMHTNKQPARLDERVARHWLSSNNRIFSMGYYDNVFYLESDHVVSPDFFDSAIALMDYADDSFAMLNMGCHGTCLGKYNEERNYVTVFPLQNIGVIYRRHGWEAFMKHGVEAFCSMYGDWDHNFHNVLSAGIVPNYKSRSLGFTSPRVIHTTTCYTSRRKFDHGCSDPDKLHKDEYEKFVKKYSLKLGLELKMFGSESSKQGGPIKRNADEEIKELCLEASKQIF